MRRLNSREASGILASNVHLSEIVGDERESDELIAAYLRRCAGVLCPCSTSELIRAVWGRLAPVSSDADFLKTRIADVLTLLIGYGDILEQTDIYTAEREATRLLYLQKPSFVWLDRSALLIGIASDGARLLSAELEARVDYSRHRRQIQQEDNEDLKELLLTFGLTELDPTYWRRVSNEPFEIQPEEYIAEFRCLLKPNPGGLEGLEVLDGRKNPRYYKGRWSKPTSAMSGLFVARRPQMFGNNLWCVVELVSGRATRMADLPQLDKRAPGRNEAWRLQMAIDAINDTPQTVKVEYTNKDTLIFTFFSPIPTWEQRQLENVGHPVDGPGLFSFEVPFDDAEKQLQLLTSDLWLRIEDSL